ncbi:hypothetical protein MUK42_10694 [Musa troglodytarum]|uniref:Uncharacterized protein n=1 Tax=Musa troglodytarum TaxID=320322 RepID=A0A9E7GUA2_9LILI|nr:hypothetical protein MUK42_10694 [Musa troglodytarum]
MWLTRSQITWLRSISNYNAASKQATHRRATPRHTASDFDWGRASHDKRSNKPDAIHLLLSASEEQISSNIGLELKALLCTYLLLLLLLRSFAISMGCHHKQVLYEKAGVRKLISIYCW